jgi:uncharacterized OsmC-like protein
VFPPLAGRFGQRSSQSLEFRQASTEWEQSEMDRETLKALQAPLKLQYQKSPETANVCLVAEGVVDFDVPGCRVAIPQNDGRFITAGLHPNAGGDGTQACSGEILLQSLVTCAGTTLAAVSISMGLQITKAHVYAKGWLDFRGTMGVDRSSPVGFTGIDLEFRIETEADDSVVRKLIELTERYCVIYQTLTTSTAVTSSRT